MSRLTGVLRSVKVLLALALCGSAGACSEAVVPGSDAPSHAVAPPPAAEAPPSRPARAAPADEAVVPPADHAPLPMCRVRVVTRNGGETVPVENATVTLVAPAGTWQAVTGAGGTAAVRFEGAGPVTLWARADGFALARVICARVESEEPVVELSRGARLRIVWTSAGAETPSAEVRKRFDASGVTATATLAAEDAVSSTGWNDPTSPLRAPHASWQTEVPLDWSGAVASLRERLAPGRWRLVVARPSGAPFVTPALTVGTEDEVEIRVDAPPDAPARRVKIVDAVSGSPVAGTKLRSWTELVKDFAYLPGASRSTGADGVAELPLPSDPKPATRVTWTVESAADAGEFDEGLLAARPEEQPLVIRVFPAACVEGTAYAKPGVPAAGCEVTWSRRGRTVRTLCDAAGRFTLAGIAVRRSVDEAVPVSLSVGGESRFYAVQAAGGATTSVVLGLRDATARCGRVQGVVRAGDRPLAGLQVVLAPIGQSRTVIHTATRSDGTFSFDAVPEGPAKIRVTCGDPRVSEGFGITSSTPFQVPADEAVQLTYDLPDAAVRVAVVDAATNCPVAGARVTARPADAREASGRFPGAAFAPGWSAFTDASGSATLVGLVSAVPHRLEAVDGSGRSASRSGATPGTVAAPSDVRLALER